MPISEDDFLASTCSGVVAESFRNLDAIQDAIEAFLTENLPTCLKYLPGMSDGTAKVKGEKELAVSLCKRLKAIADEKRTLFTFFNEDPDDHSGRTDDMSVLPSVGMSHLKVGSYYYDCEDQVYIIEAKRLPPPERSGRGDRTREYVVSDWDQIGSARKRKTGGIERFKEGLHGRRFSRCGMVAFVQSGMPDEWLKNVNAWIDELIASPISSHAAIWSKHDLLSQLDSQRAGAGVTEYRSLHHRVNNVAVSLRHYWLVLN